MKSDVVTQSESVACSHVVAVFYVLAVGEGLESIGGDAASHEFLFARRRQTSTKE